MGNRSAADERRDPRRRPDEEPEVSVILPAFNPSQQQLAAAVASVLSQPNADIELIIVDDGSAVPLTTEHLSDGRIVLHRQDNAGVGAARQAGLNLARGQWVAFLDHDDTWLPGSLDRRLEVLKRQVPDVVGVLSAPIGPTEGGGEGPWFAVPDITRGQARRLSRVEYCDLQMRHGYFLLQGAVFRRDALSEIGGFDTSLVAGEDQDLLFRLLHRNHLVFLQEPSFRRMLPGMTADPTNSEMLAGNSYRMIRKQVDEVRRSWTPKEAAAFWAFHDACVRRCLRNARQSGDLRGASVLRRDLSVFRSARNLIAWIRSFV
jgi:glycosyltransferase involved in cell wall biosynthesis